MTTNHRSQGHDFVASMWAEAKRKAENAQMAAWAEFHSHCPHTPEESIACDMREAYVTFCAEIAAKQQRESWRSSEPMVRSDATRIERDHYFALEMNA